MGNGFFFTKKPVHPSDRDFNTSLSTSEVMSYPSTYKDGKKRKKSVKKTPSPKKTKKTKENLENLDNLDNLCCDKNTCKN